jgi:hypothetical protein
MPESMGQERLADAHWAAKDEVLVTLDEVRADAFLRPGAAVVDHSRTDGPPSGAEPAPSRTEVQLNSGVPSAHRQMRNGNWVEA